MTSNARTAGRRIRAATLLGIVLLSRPGCSAHDQQDGPLPPGDWGGDHMRLSIGDGTGEIEYDCAYGTIDLPLVVVDGVFEASGTHSPGAGGPVGREGLPRFPAHYTGRVDGSRMTLLVTMQRNGTESVGSFSLRRGQAASVFKCV